MPKRPYLVLSNRELIPLEGPCRVEEHQGEWYVLGEHDAVACASREEAERSLRLRRHEHDADALAREALEGLEGDFEVVDIRP